MSQMATYFERQRTIEAYFYDASVTPDQLFPGGWPVHYNPGIGWDLGGKPLTANVYGALIEGQYVVIPKADFENRFSDKEYKKKT
jgi:hypothetical protein